MNLGINGGPFEVYRIIESQNQTLSMELKKKIPLEIALHYILSMADSLKFNEG